MSIQIEHLTLGFDELRVLDDVTLTVEAGEFVSLIAPSGAGKSTLIKALSGILTPDQGKITVDGQAIDGLSTAFSYMPQDHLLLPWLTVRENAVLWHRINKQPIDEQQLEERLKVFGLWDYRDFIPEELSGGLRQRAALLRSVNNPAKYLLLDEPFGALDSMTRTIMQDWFLHLSSDIKRTTLLVTHDIEEAIYLSSKVIVLSKRPMRVKEIFDITAPFESRDRQWLASQEPLRSKIFDGLHASGDA